MTKYTPGPWIACFETLNGETVGFHIAGKKRGSVEPICERPRVDWEGLKPYETLEANANLIAAAPDMLEALKAVVARFEAVGFKDFNTPLLPQMRAAIAKAEGVT